MKALAGIRTVVLLMLLAAGSTGAATLYITDDNNGDQPDIQAGVATKYSIRVRIEPAKLRPTVGSWDFLGQGI